MFSSGHMSEHLIWAPDPNDDVAFTLYAAESEHQIAYNEAIKLLNQTVGCTFWSIDDVAEYVQAKSPSVASQLDYSDYRKLFFNFLNF